VDLATSDSDAAKSFYGGLFGWQSEDMDGAGGTCTIFRLDGKHVAGCFEGPDGGAGVPPHWNSYLQGSDVRVMEHDGQVVVDPLEVAAGGRVSVVADPQGAAFGLFDGPLDP
jgi:uncharacterized protein